MTPRSPTRRVAAVASALRERDWLGDEPLAEDIEALLGGSSLLRRAIPIDLDELSIHLEGGLDETAFLDLGTGQILIPEFDEVEDPDDVVEIDRPDEAPWSDLEAFARAVVDSEVGACANECPPGRGMCR